MPLNDFHCNTCHKTFEEISPIGVTPQCRLCESYQVEKVISAPKGRIKLALFSEMDRREGKRERVTTMMDRQLRDLSSQRKVKP